MTDTRPPMTRREAIRAFCYECMGYQMLARDCPDQPCPLWEYRLGSGQDPTDTPLRPDHYRRFEARRAASQRMKDRLRSPENAQGKSQDGDGTADREGLA